MTGRPSLLKSKVKVDDVEGEVVHEDLAGIRLVLADGRTVPIAAPFNYEVIQDA